MYEPNYEHFINISKDCNLIPVYREILADLDTPVSAYLKLNETPSFLLESLEGGEKWARYSFLGLQPDAVFKASGTTMTIERDGIVTTETVSDPIEFLKQTVQQYTPYEPDTLPRFYGGLVGYLGYDMVRFMEDLPTSNPPGLNMPDMFMMLTNTLLVFDNLRQTIKVVYNVHLDGSDPRAAYDRALERINAVIARLRAPLPSREPSAVTQDGGEFLSSFGSREEFMAAVEKSKEYIRAGDVFQLVLSQRFQRSSTVNPVDVYRALRVINPSPYMYYLDTGEGQIVGSSPEILVRLEGDDITLRPIAGTRPRGATAQEDQALAEELRGDPKECAEHIMLVDLGRNDVGRVARTGSVKVSDLMTIERYSHVMHLVSNVEGKLQDGLDCFDVLRASFPAGTVSGAPKIRAMQIIDELEPQRRGPYAGSVGYFGYSGNMDICITIRTIIIKDAMVYAQAGAGIVADSVAASEYQETRNKALGMMKAVDMAEKGLG